MFHASQLNCLFTQFIDSNPSSNKRQHMNQQIVKRTIKKLNFKVFVKTR
jgi:hypothetical protein